MAPSAELGLAQRRQLQGERAQRERRLLGAQRHLGRLLQRWPPGRWERGPYHNTALTVSWRDDRGVAHPNVYIQLGADHHNLVSPTWYA